MTVNRSKHYMFGNRKTEKQPDGSVRCQWDVVSLAGRFIADVIVPADIAAQPAKLEQRVRERVEEELAEMS
jgi:hypothetical protein